MKRMWMRFSVLFGVSIIFAIFLPFVIAALVHRTGLVDPAPWSLVYNEEIVARRHYAVIGLTASAGLVGILVGTRLSRALAALVPEPQRLAKRMATLSPKKKMMKLA